MLLIIMSTLCVLEYDHFMAATIYSITVLYTSGDSGLIFFILISASCSGRHDVGKEM